MKRVTLQDIFNAAWQHFIIEDNPPATVKCAFPNLAIEHNSPFACRYLTPDGYKCAIGLCIPDGHPYQTEQMSFAMIVHNDRISDNPLFDITIHIQSNRQLKRFQERLHDKWINQQTGKWRSVKTERRQEYIALANEYNLTIPQKTN